ncbi:Carnitine monooxygenase reductase subunit, partial [Lachnellula suecica]
MDDPNPDLDAPFTRDTLVQLRTSKMKPMHNLSITTGIYKQPVTTRVFCSTTGLRDDEHDLTFHGGVDKAVHQYHPGHYAAWRAEFPHAENIEAFGPGGFGENLVSGGGMNERNVCIGDVIQVGEVTLQVSLPRQPCFKLNHRFGLEAFAPQTWRLSRTGWYYRVLREGYMGVGDEMVLVERPHPRWTIERVQEYLHRDRGNLDMLRELAAIGEFGGECKGAFRHLIEAAENKERANEPETWRTFQLVEKRVQTPRISSFTFKAVEVKRGTDEEELDPGCFVRLRLPNGLIRSYSLVSGSSTNFTLGIAREESGRGGSRWLHDELKLGDKLDVGKITPGVPIKEQASNHIFIAAGIGITAFLSHGAIYDKVNFNYTLHFAVRSEVETPFKAELATLKGKVVLYDNSKGERMDVRRLLAERLWGSAVYVCGPDRLISDVQACCSELNIADEDVHYEAFQTDASGDSFSVEVDKGTGGGKKGRLEVGEQETLLGVLREAGWVVDSSCGTGNCGTCVVSVCS